jgi:outer membrane receptor protein involved in Fe transport
MSSLPARFCLFLLLLSPVKAYTQSAGISGRVTLGTVPAEQVSVSLRSGKDSALIRATTTNTQGHYTLATVTPGIYLLVASGVGIVNQSKKISVGNGDVVVDFSLQESINMMKDVTISARRPLITRSIDKTVVHIESSVYKKGENGYALFNVIPGVVADNAGSVTFGGTRNVTVYVDDNRVRLQGEDLMRYLRSIPSEDIKSYEVKTVSGAEYEGSSTGVVINIVLKKEARYGLTGNVNSSFERHRYSNFSNGADLNYRVGQLGIKANYNYYTGKNFSDDSQHQFYKDAGIYTDQLNLYRDDHVHLHNFSAGLSYFLTGKQLFSVDYRLMELKVASEGNVINNMRHSAGDTAIDSAFKTLNRKATDLDNQQVDVLYRIKLDTAGSKLDVAYNYLGYHNALASDLINTFLDSNGQPIRDPQGISFTNPAKVRFSTFSADLLTISNKKTSFQIGSRYNTSETDNAIDYFDGFTPASVFNPQRSSSYVYTEKIFGVYGTFSHDFQKWSVKAGLRGENTNYSGSSRSRTQEASMLFISDNRFDFFPSLFIQYKPGEKNQFSFAYSRKVTRPSYTLLNPIEDIADPYYVSRGNPDLLPFFSDNLELNYTRNSVHNFSLFYNRLRGIINTVYFSEGKVIVESYANANNEDKLGLSYSSVISLTKWWEITSYFSLTYDRIYLLDRRTAIRKVPFYGSLTSRFQLPGGYHAEVNGFYITNNFYSIYDLKPQGRINFAFKKSYLSNKLTVTLNANDPFNLTRIGYTINEKDFYRDVNRTLPTRSVSLGLSYSFSSGRRKGENIDKSDNSASEKERL